MFKKLIDVQLVKEFNVNLMFIGPCIIAIVEEWKTNLMSLVILFHLLCAQHVSDINISIFRSLRLRWWIYHIGRLVLSSLCVGVFAAADIWWCSFCRLKHYCDILCCELLRWDQHDLILVYKFVVFFKVTLEVFGCRKQGVTRASETFDSLPYWDIEAGTSYTATH